MERSEGGASNTMSSHNNPKNVPSGVGEDIEIDPNNLPHDHPTEEHDIGWRWGYMPFFPNKKIRVRCKLCKHESSGGITRLKEHIAGISGNVRKCSKAKEDDRKLAMASIRSAKDKKIQKAAIELEQRSEVAISKARLEEDEGITMIGNKRPRHQFGGLFRYATSLPDEPSLNDNVHIGKPAILRQSTLDEAERKKKREMVHEYVAWWAYEAAIPFNAFTLQSFANMCEAIGQYGPGYVGPTMYQLREPLLVKAKKKIYDDLELQKKDWAVNGCSLMTDSWTDKKGRCVMNMCVHSGSGVSFYNSMEDSASSHTAVFIFDWVDRCIGEIGEEKIIQVVTDNHAANMAAKDLLKEKRPTIFWTSCAAHTVDLMLEDIGRITKFKSTVDKAKGLTTFIYAHHRTLALMRRCTKRKDIVRPGATRFATSFLTLTSLLEKKEALMAMFASPEFTNMNFKRDAIRKSETANATVISKAFWNNIRHCLRVWSPLIRVLRMVDSDRHPSMGFIVGELSEARNEIMSVFKNVEKDYKPIIEIIDRKATGRLDSSLHLAAWFLNPLYYFAEDGDAMRSSQAKMAVFDCAEVIFNGDRDVIDAIPPELLRYKERSGYSGRDVARRAVDKIKENRNPGEKSLKYKV